MPPLSGHRTVDDHTRPTLVTVTSEDKQSYDDSDNNDLDEDNVFDIPESKTKRLLELRLLQNWITEISGASHTAQQNPAMNETWRREVPKLAVLHDNLLHAIFSASATHLLRAEPGNLDLIAARQTYIGLASREQRHAVEHLDSTVFDAVCFSALIMVMNSFAMLQERELEQYTPPTEWLQMGKGAGVVFSILISCASQDDKPKIMAIVEGDSAVDDTLFSQKSRIPFKSLLQPWVHGNSSEVWDDETREAYEETVSFVGSMLHGLDLNEPIHARSRRIIAFTLQIPPKFIDLVVAQEPRALVIFAYFWALCTKAEEVWWLGDTPKKELQGLQSIVPPEWQPLLQWPLSTAGLILS